MGRLILITNDDGIDAGGIRQLAETAKAFGEVWVVAPESQRSGKSHSVTYLEPLYVRERPGYMDGVKAYECSGVPVDCVRVGIHLLGRKPDVVLSGINSGYNYFRRYSVFRHGGRRAGGRFLGNPRHRAFPGQPRLSSRDRPLLACAHR